MFSLTVYQRKYFLHGKNIYVKISRTVLDFSIGQKVPRGLAYCLPRNYGSPRNFSWLRSNNVAYSCSQGKFLRLPSYILCPCGCRCIKLKVRLIHSSLVFTFTWTYLFQLEKCYMCSIPSQLYASNLNSKFEIILNWFCKNI